MFHFEDPIENFSAIFIYRIDESSLGYLLNEIQSS